MKIKKELGIIDLFVFLVITLCITVFFVIRNNSSSSSDISDDTILSDDTIYTHKTFGFYSVPNACDSIIYGYYSDVEDTMTYKVPLDSGYLALHNKKNEALIFRIEPFLSNINGKTITTKKREVKIDNVRIIYNEDIIYVVEIEYNGDVWNVNLFEDGYVWVSQIDHILFRIDPKSYSTGKVEVI